MTSFERAQKMMNQSLSLWRTKRAQRERVQYWLGFAFALVEFGVITRAQYAQLQILIEEA